MGKREISFIEKFDAAEQFGKQFAELYNKVFLINK